jgi:hypothetical protein
MLRHELTLDVSKYAKCILCNREEILLSKIKNLIFYLVCEYQNISQTYLLYLFGMFHFSNLWLCSLIRLLLDSKFQTRYR